MFGEGPPDARVVLVGEQPGDQEDKAGHPFVGPAGRVLHRAIDAAGLDRRDLYLTNAVKHFKWRPVGKRRLHQKPNAAEMHACKPWLEAELAALRPEALVCLGATATQSVLGGKVKVMRDRGVPIESDLAPLVIVTVHPSSILRADDEARGDAMAAFVRDLAVVRTTLAERSGAPA